MFRPTMFTERCRLLFTGQPDQSKSIFEIRIYKDNHLDCHKACFHFPGFF
jgi:hypothetical protein